jgi:hypothetical protein
MKCEASYEPRGLYLRARVSGPYDPAEARALLKQTREQAIQAGFTRIFIDAMDVEAPPSEIERYSMGEVFAIMLPPPFRVAVLYAKPTGDKFMENTAVLRGADLLICGDEMEALGWLLADAGEEAADDERP